MLQMQKVGAYVWTMPPEQARLAAEEAMSGVLHCLFLVVWLVVLCLWQGVSVGSAACFAEPSLVKASVECLSSAADSDVHATTDPYLVLCAGLDSLNELLHSQRQKPE